MKAQLMLADYAQVSDGKLHMIGGGWNVIGPKPVPFALALLIEVPWDRANERHRIRLDLLDADGQPVEVPAAEGGTRPLVIEAAVEVGRPAGLKPGASLSVPLAINLPPQPLPLDRRFEWRLTINGEADEHWLVAFSTRAS